MVTDEVLLYPRRRRHIIKKRASNAHPYSYGFCAGKVGTDGTDKSVPYERPLAAAESGELIAVVFKFNPSAAKLPAPLDRRANGCGTNFALI